MMITSLLSQKKIVYKVPPFRIIFQQWFNRLTFPECVYSARPARETSTASFNWPCSVQFT